MSRELSRVHIIVFPGVQNLPNFAAEANGFFERRGLAIETTFTKSSEQQRNGLARGEYDIAHSAVDNAVAMVENAGENVAIVVGLDHGFNKLIVRPGIASYDDLRGKTLGVDAPDTAFALVVYEMLKRKGLNRNDYKVQSVGATRFRLDALIAAKVDFAMLNLPFNLFAQRAGLAVLDNPMDVIGAYQSTGGFVKRTWAEQHRGVLVQYIAAYIEGLRWSMDPSNRSAVIELMKQRMDLAADIAEQCFQQISDPKSGFAHDAKLDLVGMANLLALRTDFSDKPSAATISSDCYIDEAYYRDALAALLPGTGGSSRGTSTPAR
jgi:ABC-type nitrate/sulfonate/bicarbonate transport system substrate-binding protein